MALELRYDRNGALIPTWYGRYTDAKGKRQCKPLCTIEGVPYTRSANGPGDEDFVESRKNAESALKSYVSEARMGRIDKTTALKIYKDRTGSKLRITNIADLLKLSDEYEDGRKITAGWKSWKRKIISEFSEWALGKSLETALDIDQAVAQKYLKKMYTPDKDGHVLTASTVRRFKAVLGEVFDKALPEGASNPWRAKGVAVETDEKDHEYNRTPLTEKQVGQLLKVAENDPTTYDLIVAALSTGLRRGDVCTLTWEGIDLKENVLERTTSKTGMKVYLPILPLFKKVLQRRSAERKDGAVFVFPEAERMLRENPDGITWRIKKAFALALGNQQEDGVKAIECVSQVTLPEVLGKVLEAVQHASMAERKRGKMMDVLKRYSDGQSYRVIGIDTGFSRGQISNYLHEAEKLADVAFVPDRRQLESVKRLIKDATLTKREFGNRLASKYDFHALRTTFVTLALSAGIGVEILKALTGHATVEIVMRHYFKPKGSDFMNELTKAMPKVLTSTKRGKAAQAIPKKVTAVLRFIKKQGLSKDDIQMLKELI